MNIQIDFSLVLALIYLLLHVFGWGYDRGVAWAEREGYAEGYMGYIVAFGTAITLLPFAFMGQPVSIWWVYGAFVASGMPMILGSTWRHIQARKREQDGQRTDAVSNTPIPFGFVVEQEVDDGQTKSMAERR